MRLGPPCRAWPPSPPTCTSQHPADGRHGTSVPGQGEGDSSLLPCCHRGRGRVLTPPAPNHRPARPSHHRPGARRLAMGWAVPGAGGSSALRHNTAPQQEDLERDRTVQWDPTAGPCPVPLGDTQPAAWGQPGMGRAGGPVPRPPSPCAWPARSRSSAGRGAAAWGPAAAPRCGTATAAAPPAGAGTAPGPAELPPAGAVGGKGRVRHPIGGVSPAHMPSTTHPAPHTHTAAALTSCPSHGRSGHQLTRHHRLPELPPQPCPKPGTAPHCPSPPHLAADDLLLQAVPALSEVAERGRGVPLPLSPGASLVP